MQLTQKVRIFPTPDQKEVLWKLSEKCRLIYNFALKERIEAWKNDTRVNYYKQQNDLPQIKEKHSRYKIVYSKVLQHTLRTLDADYKSFFSLWKKGHKDARPPKFKGRKYFTTMVYNQSGFKLRDNMITLSHKCNDVSLKFSIPDKFSFDRIYQVAVFREGVDLYLSITYEQPEKVYVDNGKYQAIDLGITNIVTAVNTDGKFIQIRNQRPDKYWLPRMRELQSMRDHCKKESKRWKLLNKTLKRCQRKCANQIKDFQHKLSRKIVDNTKANTIIVGELSPRNMCKTKSRGLNRAIQNTGTLGRFVGFLTYKAKIVGKRVIENDERRTSKTCCVCGKIHDMMLWDRTMICDCGNVLDRDKNSAVNQMNRFLSQNALWMGYQLFAGNLRQTGILIQNTVLHSQEAPSKNL